MAVNTKIEWTDHTWNPWYGCPDDGKRSPACAHCYARSWAKRSGIVDFDNEIKRAARATFKAPLNRRKYNSGDKVFVCSLSDFCHPAEEIADMQMEAFDVMRERDDLTWLILTKRPDGLETLMQRAVFCGIDWPPPNWWLGVTVENNDQRWRIDELLAVPAAVHFVSCEPLLGPLDLRPQLLSSYDKAAHDPQMTGYENRNDKLDWVIVGGESGPGARPMHPEWVRSLRDQCEEYPTAFLFKQWGEYREAEDALGILGDDAPVFRDCSPNRIIRRIERGQLVQVAAANYGKGSTFVRVGKHQAGRVLDGQTYDEYPEV